MDNTYIPINVERQFPRFIREEYPTFVKFMKVYYSWIQDNEKDISIDADLVEDQFLELFRKQYAIDLNQFSHLDFRTFLRYAKQFYTTRGTEESLKFLFRALFNEEISVEYPGRNVLIASGGKWEQTNHIEVQTIKGTSPIVGSPFIISKNSIQYSYDILRLEQTDETGKFLVTFKIYDNVLFESGDSIYQYDQNGMLAYVGRVVPTVSTINIEVPGKFWKIGQIIRFEGTLKNTLAEVTNIGPSGELRGVKILEFGYGHQTGQAILVSPILEAPSTSSTTITQRITAVNPTVIEYTLLTKEQLLDIGFRETVSGVSTDQDFFIANPGFFQRDPGYFGRYSVLTSDPVVQVSSSTQPENSDVDAWTISQTILSLSKDYLVRDAGRYITNESLISEESIRLQDNFYYQAFSYVVETEQALSSVKNVIDQIHPAGMKYFTSQIIEFNLHVQFIVDFLFAQGKVSGSDELLIIDSGFIFDFHKVLLDLFTFNETKAFTLTNVLSTDLQINEANRKKIRSRQSSTFILDDQISKILSKDQIADNVEINDFKIRKNTNKLWNEDFTTTDEMVIIFRLLAQDSITLDDGSDINYSYSDYVDENYFTEGYISKAHQLIIHDE